MDQQYQPLFNRTYLKILPWIVAIVIVLITANNQNNESFPYETIEDNWIYSSIDKEITQDQLKLVFPISPAYTEQQTQQRIALQTSIGLALQERKNITAQWQDDKLILTLLLANDNISNNSSKIVELLDKLIASAGQYYSQAQQRARAERYLTLNSIDELALSNLKAQLANSSTPRTPNNIHNLLSNQPIALLILKKQNPSLSSNISEQLKKHYSLVNTQTTPVSQSIKSSKINLLHRGSSYLYLIGQAITPDDKNISRTLAFHYINQTIKPLTDKNLSRYHLLLQPAAPLGFVALSMTKKSPFQENVTNNLQTYLLKHLNDERLEPLKTSLSSQYSEQLSTPEQRANLLATTLFSGEKFQSADEFHDTLAAITTDQIKAHIQQLFDPKRAMIVKISPP